MSSDRHRQSNTSHDEASGGVRDQREHHPPSCCKPAGGTLRLVDAGRRRDLCLFLGRDPHTRYREETAHRPSEVSNLPTISKLAPPEDGGRLRALGHMRDRNTRCLRFRPSRSRRRRRDYPVRRLVDMLNRRRPPKHGRLDGPVKPNCILEGDEQSGRPLYPERLPVAWLLTGAYRECSAATPFKNYIGAFCP